MKPQHRRPTHTRRRTAVTLIGLSLALVAGLAASSPALAAKGGGGGGGGGKPAPSGSSSLALVLLDSTDGVAHWGQRVTFEVSTTATSRPSVSLNCYQNGSWVLTASVGFYPEYPWAQEFSLSSGWWTSGAADCTAQLYYVNSHGKNVNLTSLDVPVAA
jgi:hypothetical protein